MTELRASQPAFRGRIVRLDIEDWEGHPPYEVVHHPGAAAVLPITPDGHVLLVNRATSTPVSIEARVRLE